MQALHDHFSWFEEDENGGVDCEDEQIWQLGFWESVLMKVHLEQVHEEAIDLSEIEKGIRVFLGFLERNGNERVLVSGTENDSAILKDNIFPLLAYSSILEGSPPLTRLNLKS